MKQTMTKAWRDYSKANGGYLSEAEWKAFRLGWDGLAFIESESLYPDTDPTANERAWAAGRKAREGNQ